MNDNITYSQFELNLRSIIIDSQKSIIYIKAYDNNRVLDILRSLGMNGWIWKESTGHIFNLKTGDAIIFVGGNDDKPIKCKWRTNKLSDSIRNLLNYKKEKIKILVAQISNKLLKDDKGLIQQLEELIKRNKDISNEERQVVVLLSNDAEVDPRLVSLCEKINVSISGIDKMAQYGIKPIRTRFVSGKKECTTISQLRSNFSPKAIYNAYPQLLKWLDQNHEKEIRELLVTNKDKICKEDHQTSLFLLYEIFFHDMFKERGITDLTSLCRNWYSNSERDTKNYKYLFKEIKERSWGDLFFLDLLSNSWWNTNRSSQDDLFEIYKSFCEGCVFLKDITNLSKLYVYLAKDSKYKKNFTFLEKIIRNNKWSFDFYLQLIPCLFEKKSKDEDNLTLVQLENISLSIETEKDLCYFYNYFLGKELDFLQVKNTDDVLPNLFFYFKSDDRFIKNISTFRDVIKNASWRIDFVCKIMPRLFEAIRNSPQEQIHVGDVYLSKHDLFGVYEYFLINYFKENNISDIYQLYYYWSADNSGIINNVFLQLHNEIYSTKYGIEFFNNAISNLFSSYRRSIGYTLNHSDNDYDIDEELAFVFFRKYFNNYFEKYKFINSIKNISELYVKWSLDSDYKKGNCFITLNEIMKNNIWGISRLLQLYNKNKKRIYSEKEWKKLFKELTKKHNKDTDHIYKIGKIYIDDFNSCIEGMSFIKRAKELGNTDAKRYLEDYCGISKDFKKWFKKIDKDDWRNNIDGGVDYKTNDNLKELANSWHEKWILATQSLIHKIINMGDYWKLYNYIGYIRDFKNDDRLMDIYPYDIAPKYFIDFFRDRSQWNDRVDHEDLMKDVVKYKGIMFVEIRFVLGLLYRNYKKRKDYGNAILKSLESVYPPARYILNEKYGNSERINTLRNKLKIDFNEGLRYYCTNMVDFMTE